GGSRHVNEVGLSRKHLIEGTREALERLQLEYVDLVFAHRPDIDTPMEETVRAFNNLIETGLAFYWGTSEWSAEQIQDAYRVSEKLGLISPLMEQPQYNMIHRENVEQNLIPLFKEYGLGTTIWSPLAFGILTGKYNKGIPDGSRLSVDKPMTRAILKDLSSPKGQENLAKVEKLKLIAEKLKCTLAQLALAWCLKNPHVSTAMVGATSPEQLIENLSALSVVGLLTEDILSEIDLILANKPVVVNSFR
ncbi:hypothetical protein HK100_012145, partial [Physocladia obscura]